MDDNWFMATDSDAGGMNIDTSGFDWEGADAPGYYENVASGAQFDWNGGDLAGQYEQAALGNQTGDPFGNLNLTDAEWQQLNDYVAANPGVLDSAYGSGWQGFLNNAGSTLSGAAKGAGSWLGSLSPNTLGAGALLASGLISAKEARDLLNQQTANQKELLQYKHDLEKPTAWVQPTRGLLRLQ